MYRNPAYPPAENSSPPEERGQRLLTIPRERDGAELRLSLDDFEGHAFLALRVWRRADDGSWWPTRKGLGIRIREVARLAEALAAAVPANQSEAPRQDLAQQPPSTNQPPAWVIDLVTGHQCQPAPLVGTPKQITYAERIRSSRMAAVRIRAPELLPVLASIKPAGWWIANQSTPLAELRWPSPEQTTRPEEPEPEPKELDEFS